MMNMHKLGFFSLMILFFLLLSVYTVKADPNSLSKEENSQVVNYDEVRIKVFPVAMQCWTYRKFTFFETLEKVKTLGIKYLQAYPGQPLSPDQPDLKFDHNMTDEQISMVKDRLSKDELSVVAYGVVGFENSEESMEKVFEFARKMGIRTIVTEPKFDDYTLIEKMVIKYDRQVAIHNHPTPSKYAQPQTVLDHIKDLDKRIGACADIGHWTRTGVNPVDGLRLLKGRILDVHLKDLNEFGLKEAYDVAFGSGKSQIRDVLAELSEQNYRGYLAIEYENEKEVLTPEADIQKGLDFLKRITHYMGYTELSQSKHGWNHYGPGYFDLDETSGVLTSSGGMGLFWYSAKKYKDFVLELDYKCSTKTTNSGVFYRIPDFITSNEYISKSFEIQIDDNSQGTHGTGAAYDAQAPVKFAGKPTGEWNHYKITCKGKNIKVELNDQLVLDWNMEPRGKINEFFLEGYFGLQNHDSRSPVYFKNVHIKEL
jgi:sugar phosphate isomerase/epimerase